MREPRPVEALAGLAYAKSDRHETHDPRGHIHAGAAEKQPDYCGDRRQPKTERHSREVVAYLHQNGYDVIPVRPDRVMVEGLPTFATLADFGGHVDLAVTFRRRDAVPAHIDQAAVKHAYAVWLPPGVWSREAELEAQRQNVGLIKERCIIDEHKRLVGAIGEAAAGNPKHPGVHFGRRTHATHAVAADRGYTAAGGGGSSAGGGVRAALDEKKMTRRRASRKRR
jgi:predicted CoA-binding protein